MFLDFFVVMISPILASNIGYGTYVLWCATNIVFIPVVYLMSKADLVTLLGLLSCLSIWLTVK